MNDDQSTTLFCTIATLLSLQEREDLNHHLECTLHHLMRAFPEVASRVLKAKNS